MDLEKLTRTAYTLMLTMLPLQAGMPATVQAQSDPGDVRFAVMGNRELDGSITGETVPVHVPWEGVNQSQGTVNCLVGPFQLRSDGPEERAQIGPDGAVMLRLQLDTDDEGRWEVQQSSGRCATLGGSGSFRRTVWDDGAVSYRFIGAASLSASGAES